MVDAEVERLRRTHAPHGYLSVSDLRKIYGLSASNIYRIASENGWRRTRMHGCVWYLVRDVAAWDGRRNAVESNSPHQRPPRRLAPPGGMAEL